MVAASERRLRGNKVISTLDPPVTIRVDRALFPLGRLTFTLSGVAEVELFAFLQGRSQQADRLLVIQFEHFRDDNAYSYAYPQARPIEIAGLPFLTDSMQLPLVSPVPDSDIGQLLGLVQARGYHLPPYAVVQRFVHLADAAHRKALQILYVEAAHPAGAWPHPDAAAHRAFQERALSTFRLKPTAPAT
jgi:hypothetical protein